MVSPMPDERDTKKIKRFTHYGLAHQPVDLREGVAKAYTVVKEVKKNKYLCNSTGKHLSLNFFSSMLPPPGDHRHCADNLRHSHQGARAAGNDGSGGRSSAPAAACGGQAAHHGHRSHVQRAGWDEEPDPPRRTAGGIPEMEAGRGVAAAPAGAQLPAVGWTKEGKIETSAMENFFFFFFKGILLNKKKEGSISLSKNHHKCKYNPDVVAFICFSISA